MINLIALSFCFLLLIYAAYEDIMYMEIHDFVWIIIICITFVTAVVCNKLTTGSMLSLVIYFALQEKVMVCSYGRADCHAFCACGMIFAMLGKELEVYTLHMAISLLIIVIHQLARRNIGRNGKLKVEIPMVPYITASFAIVLVMEYIIPI